MRLRAESRRITERIAAWNDPDLSQLPVIEPGLADMVFIAVNTPTKSRGLGGGRALQRSQWAG